MKWLTNTYDPKSPKARLFFIENEEWNWETYLEWLSDKIIGEPKDTEYFSVKELRKMNMVGIYEMAE